MYFNENFNAMGKILIVDDHKLLIDAVITLIESIKGLEVVGYCLDGEEAVAFYEKNSEVDLIIMDIHMPKMDGIEASKKILSINPNQKILAFTTYSDKQLVKRIFEAGIKGFVDKAVKKEEVINAIQKMLSCGYYACSLAVKVLIDTIYQKDSIDNLLTEREKMIIKLICKQYSTKEIADELSVSVRTVELYKKSLIEKIKVKNAAGIVMYAVKNDLFTDNDVSYE